MRYLKGLAIAAVAAAALVAFGAGGASAAEFYSTGVTLESSRTLHFSIEAGTTSTTSTTDGKTLIGTCTEFTIEATTTGFTFPHINVLTYDKCTFTTDTVTNGSLAVDASGTVTGSGSVVTINTGVTCRYGTGTGTHLGTLSTGKIAINAVINEQEPKAFLCPDTTKWVANLTGTSPHDLTVK